MVVMIKKMLSTSFDMKDLEELSFILAIEIHKDKSRKLLVLSQKAYIDKVLKRFDMENRRPSDVLIVKRVNSCKDQYPENDIEKNSMENVPYASAMGSLMYAQVCTRPDLS
uniref:Retrovirus-related Pol polyprotein from transposon TNT 1-94 n=1 Tax=Cajanus cajan TaxID=3821 RepID=A0A151U3W9_CAJCA|nr:Retrovirus-related Pol polyprotein from transposon TNT 1-94 [Cajanus cajan]